MQQFNHPNVMGLLGVCLDAGPTPYIVLPFLSGGNLLSHVRNRASSLVLSDKALTTKVLCSRLGLCGLFLEAIIMVYYHSLTPIYKPCVGK